LLLTEEVDLEEEQEEVSLLVKFTKCEFGMTKAEPTETKKTKRLLKLKKAETDAYKAKKKKPKKLNLKTRQTRKLFFEFKRLLI
jgi:hypothetical protein